MNNTLLEACNGLVERGLMTRVGTAFQYVGTVDFVKMVEVARSYEEAFHKGWQERRSKELEAHIRLRDYVITF